MQCNTAKILFIIISFDILNSNFFPFNSRLSQSLQENNKKMKENKINLEKVSELGRITNVFRASVNNI